MELLKDYDYTILYHPGKSNIVANALSRNSIGSLAHIATFLRPIIRELHKLEESGVQFETRGSGPLLAHIKACSSLVEKVKEAQKNDARMQTIIDEVREGKANNFTMRSDGV